MKTTPPFPSRRTALQHLVSAALSTPFWEWNNQGQAAVPAEKITPQNNTLLPFYIPPAAPLQLNGRGINMRTRVRSAQTNKQYSCVEFLVGPRQMGPPPHRHQNLDEIMFVLEGTVTVLVEQTVYEVPAGGWHLRPRQFVHTFWNATDQPVRYIDMYFNQNFEDFLEELNFKLLPHIAENNLSPADPAVATWWADLDRRYAITTFFDQRQPLIDKYKLKP